MNVCIVGTKQDGLLDEGMKNFAYHLNNHISKKHNVIFLYPGMLFSIRSLREIRDFQPELIHYTSGPSIFSLIILKFLKVLTNATTIISAVHPWFPYRTDQLIRFFRPDLLIVSSLKTRRFFENRGCKIKFLPLGVDTKRFIPVDENTKIKLREKYSIPKHKYIFLHVGHIRYKRGLTNLIQLQTSETMVLIVGSVSTSPELDIRNKLVQEGCTVWLKYIPRIEDIYGLADCYIFPTQDPVNAIEIPLSVLEAMSCNLPVISFPFGGLTKLFQEGDGLFFITGDWKSSIGKVLRQEFKVLTREKVLKFDWLYICAEIDRIYGEQIFKGSTSVKS